MNKVNITEKLSAFSDYFNPRIAGELNGQKVKLVKFKGEFIWHHHDHEDELFYVVKGSFDMHMRDKIITVNEGEFLIMPAASNINRWRMKKCRSCYSNRQQH